MAHSTDVVNNVVFEIDIDDNVEINFQNLCKYNAYENTEIQIDDDLCLEDFDQETLNMLDEECSLKNDALPSLQFADEEDIPLVKQHYNIKNPILSCPTCHKVYKKESFLNKHLQCCGK